MKYRFTKEEHLHELYINEKWKPLTGTSSVMSVIARPLTWWASGKAVEVLGWVNPRYESKESCLDSANKKLEEIKSLSGEEYLKLLNKAYRNFNDFTARAATAGTDLHSQLEEYVKACIESNNGVPVPSQNEKILPFVNWSLENVKRFLWSEAHCYNKDHWIGGISDCGLELNNGEYAIVDFKSSKEAYMSQFLQIAGYAIQIETNGLYTNEGEKILDIDKPITQYIVVPFGAKDCVPSIMKGVEKLKEGFLSALNLYRLINNYQE